MHAIVRLEGAIRHYDWGSRTALAELRGAPSPSERPEAELWLGAHPGGEASVVGEAGERIALGAWIACDPVAALGADVAARFGGRLPFLLKVLAVERALSLQAHPDAEQARAGFARGDGVYVDPEAKPELVVAHTRFRALAGFRPLAAIGAAFEALGLGELAPSRDADAEQWLRAFLARWLAPGEDAERSARLARALRKARGGDPAHACMRRLADEHPGDPGVIAPLLLHQVELAPGEALFLGAGELHCYLGGVAVEIMGASDNVLRAGLTKKPRAVDELLRIGRFAPRTPVPLRAEPHAPGQRRYAVPVECFELSVADVGTAGVAVDVRSGGEILLCMEGALRVASDAQPGALALRAGESCFVPMAAGRYRIEGAGRVHRAGVPAARAPIEPVR